MKKKKHAKNRRKRAVLCRYTTLPVLLDILERQSLVLLSPEKWPDRNDSELMLEYKERSKLECLLVACFSQGDETIHHWNAFAPGTAGCRINFDAEALLANLPEHGFRHGKVAYRKLYTVRKNMIRMRQIPFTKRWPYRVEEEYRILYESKDLAERDLVQKDVPIGLECIQSITLNQSMPKKVFESIRSFLGAKAGKRVSHSTLYENRAWINKFIKK